MSINRIQLECYKTPKLQRGSPAFSGRTINIADSSPQNINFGVKTDVFEAKNKKQEVNPFATKVLLPMLGVLPPIRRIESVPDKLENNNTEGAIAQVGAAALNSPSDATQLGYALKEAKFIKENGIKALPKRTYQRKMTFIKGTPLEGIAKKHKWLENADKTLFDTKFGQLTRKYCKINYNPKVDVNEIRGIFSQAKTIDAIATKGNYVQNVISRSLLRISNIGLITTAAFELPAIVKSYTKTEGTTLDKTKALGVQAIKSTGYVGLINAGIAIAGAIAFPYGVIAELVGMAIGSAVGISASKSLNKEIDNLFNCK